MFDDYVSQEGPFYKLFSSTFSWKNILFNATIRVKRPSRNCLQNETGVDGGSEVLCWGKGYYGRSRRGIIL